MTKLYYFAIMVAIISFIYVNFTEGVHDTVSESHAASIKKSYFCNRYK